MKHFITHKVPKFLLEKGGRFFLAGVIMFAVVYCVIDIGGV